MKKRNKGITLVALIITIIVMLILVAVSVQIVINSGLFDSAKTAAKRTEEAYRAEGADGGKVNIDGEVYNSIEEYMEKSCTHEWGNWQIITEVTCTVLGLQTKTCSRCGAKQTQAIPELGHSWNANTETCTRCGTTCTHAYGEYTTTAATCITEGSKKRTCSICRHVDTTTIAALGHNYSGGTCTRCGEAEPKPLAIGDYISYTPDTANTNYMKMTETTTGSGSNLKAGIPKDTTLKWRVMSINADGTVDIVTTVPIAKSVYFKDAIGYNNGVYLLNDLCKTHYSNSSL